MTRPGLIRIQSRQRLSGTARGSKGFGRCPAERQTWLDNACHRRKHQPRAPTELPRELHGFGNRPLSRTGRETLAAAVTFFENQAHRMTYAKNLAANLPIGSGVTEAACKVLVKEQMYTSPAATCLVLAQKILS